MSEKHSGRMSIIQACAYDDISMTPSLRDVLGLIGTYGDADGYCYPGQEKMAKRLGVSRQYINKSAKDLEGLGYIKIVPRKRQDGGRATNGYRILFDFILPIERRRNPEGDATVEVAGGATSTVTGGATNQVAGDATLEVASITSHSNGPIERPKGTDLLSDANRADEEKSADASQEDEWQLPEHPLQADNATEPSDPIQDQGHVPPAAEQQGHGRKKKDPNAPAQTKAPKYAEDSIPVKLALFLRNQLHGYKADMRLPGETWDDKAIQTWAVEMDHIVRLDGRDHELAARIIAAAIKDQFWQDIVHSPAKLRQHFDKLESKLIVKSQVTTCIQEGGNNNGYRQHHATTATRRGGFDAARHEDAKARYERLMAEAAAGESTG